MAECWGVGFALALTTYCLISGVRIQLFDLALPGLKTGVLQAKGRVYTRVDQPVRYWLGIMFGLVFLPLLFGFSFFMFGFIFITRCLHF